MALALIVIALIVMALALLVIACAPQHVCIKRGGIPNFLPKELRKCLNGSETQGKAKGMVSSTSLA